MLHARPISDRDWAAGCVAIYASTSRAVSRDFSPGPAPFSSDILRLQQGSQRGYTGCDNTGFRAGKKASYFAAGEGCRSVDPAFVAKGHGSRGPIRKRHLQVESVTIVHRFVELGRDIDQPNADRPQSFAQGGMAAKGAQKLVERGVHPPEGIGIKDYSGRIAIPEADVSEKGYSHNISIVRKLLRNMER